MNSKFTEATLRYILACFAALFCMPVPAARAQLNPEYKQVHKSTILSPNGFGQNVLLYKNTRVTQNPGVNVHVQTRSGNSWTDPVPLALPTLSPALTGPLGECMAMNDEWLMVAASGDKRKAGNNSQTGTIFIYRNQGSGWTLFNQYIVGGINGRTSNDVFAGSGLAINGSYAFIGIPGDDSAAVGGVTPNTVDYGAVAVYQFNGTGWVLKDKLANPEGTATGLVGNNGRFGQQVVCNGSDLFVSAPGMGNGKVYRFILQNGKWTYSGSNLSNPAGTAGTAFGNGMAIQGNILAVSAPAEKINTLTNAGAVYLYVDTNRLGSWVYSKKITSLAPATLAEYGTKGRISICGDLVIAGDPYSPSQSTRIGLVDIYQYKQTDKSWTKKNSIALPFGGLNQDLFGIGVSAWDNEILIGSYRSNGTTFMYKSKDIEASKNVTDGYIDLSWRKPTACAQANPPVTVYLQVYDSTLDQEVYSQKYDYIQNTPFAEGSFRQYVSPASQHNYTIRLLQYGNGTLLCPEAKDTGITLPFIKPVITASNDLPEGVSLKVKTSSTYNTKLSLYRDNKLIVVKSLNDSIYMDAVDGKITGSVKNGTSYKYCVEGVKEGSSDTSGKVCATGSTVPVNFKAADDVYTAKVSLSWNSMKAYCDNILILKDGVKTASLSSDKTSYDDLKAIPGFKHIYTLTLVSDNQTRLEQTDTGSIKANGSLKGYVLNNTGGFGVKGVKITLKGVIRGDSVIRSTVTDATGYYSFSELYYYTAAGFTVNASLDKINFTENNKPVSLDIKNHEARVDFESNISSGILAQNKFSFQNFKAIPVSNDDRVQLFTTYTCTDTVQLTIKRNNVIMGSYLLNPNSAKPFIVDETGGTPGETYIYTADMFYLKNNKYVKATLSDTLVYPKILPLLPVNVSADQDTTNGYIKLSWTHSSQYHTGVAVYRNGSRIGDYTGTGSGTFIDLKGANNTLHTYSLRSFSVLNNGLRYESDPVEIRNIMYPALRLVANPSQSTDNDGYMKLSWQYPFNAAAYNFSGIKITRTYNSKTDTIATLSSKESPEFTDRDAPVDAAVAYRIITYKKANNINSGVNITGSVPAIPTPSGFTATNYLEGMIIASWAYGSEKIDGFMLVKGNDTAWKAANVFTHGFALPVNYNNSGIGISIQAYRKINNVYYYSGKVNTSGASSSFSGGTLPSVTKLAASQNLPYKTTISWEYPSYYQVEFRVYRNGVYIGSVSNDARIFNDLTLLDDNSVVYGVQPVGTSPANKGRMASVLAKRINPYRLSGMASNIYSGQGVKTARVTLYQNNAKVRDTYTDSAGYYEFAPVDFYNKTGMSVGIEKAGHIFENKLTAFTTDNNTYNYNIGFSDTLNTGNEAGKEISKPKAFASSINDVNQSVILHWTSDGLNYTGFRLYRGLELIQTIGKGEALSFEDKLGAPGTNYSYRVKSYWEDEPGHILESEFLTTLASFPDLLPVNDIRLTAYNNYQMLSWDHRNDMHTYYEIKRNGTIVAKVPTHASGNYWDDKTGVQNIRYNYEITAVLERDGKVYRSPSRSFSGTYPEFIRPSNISLAIPDSNMVRLTWTNIDANTYLRKAYNIYRSGVMLAQLPGNIATYDDYTGLPNKNYRYEIKAVYTRNGTDYESKPLTADQVFPRIANPYTLSNWSYPGAGVYVGALSNPDQLTPFFILRNNASNPRYYVYREEQNKPATLLKITADPVQYPTGVSYSGQRQYFYDDRDPNCKPGQSYTYYISAARFCEGQWVEGSKVKIGSAAFPLVSAPYNVSSVLNPTLSILNTKWDYGSTESSISFEINEDRSNTTYFYGIYNAFNNTCMMSSFTGANSGRSKQYIVPGTMRSFQQGNFTSHIWDGNVCTVNGAYNIINTFAGYNLSIRAVKTIGSTKYYSNPVSFTPVPYSTPDRSIPGWYFGPTTFKATDNEYPNKVHIEWVGSGNGDCKEYRLYRDQKPLATIPVSGNNSGTYSYDDEDPIPGFQHIYSLDGVANNSPLTWEMATSDFGSVPANGQIKGSVLTLTGGMGVPNVKITATGQVAGNINTTVSKNDNYVYTTTTDASGNYVIDNVFFGLNCRYTVTAALAGHVFDKTSQNVDLDMEQPRQVAQTFFDKTAVLISGTVRRKDACPIDSAKVTLVTAYKDRPETKTETAWTSPEGRYSFNIDPNDPNLKSITVSVNDTQWNSQNQVKVINKFPVKNKTWYSFSNWPNTTVVDFEDETLYPVKLIVRSTCGSLGDYKFQVRVKATNGCYDKTFVSNNNGILDVSLPPYDYTVTTTGVNPENVNILPVIDYLSVRPLSLGLGTMHYAGAYQALMDGIFQRIPLDMVYHKQPLITMTGIKEYLCNSQNNPILWKQNDVVTLKISVNETHSAGTCHVDNGFLIIKNAAATEETDTVLYDAAVRKFKPYIFTVGTPMNVAPYTKPFIIEYHTESDGFLGELVNSVIVDGVVAQEGSDVIVQANDGQDFKLPLMVLRDPPGDESYSYIEKGTTISNTLNISSKDGGYAGLRTENQFEIFGVGAAFDAEIKAGGGSGNTASYNIAVTTKERIQTPSDNSVINADNTNFLLGDNGDVIVGAGMALKYGINERISVDNANCKVTKTSMIAISPDKINTTWIYTVDHIRKLIAEFKKNRDNVDQGTFVIEGKTAQQAKDYLSVQIQNWESVLDYHFNANLPYAALCEGSNYEKLKEPFQSQTKVWLASSGFCREIGTYTDNLNLRGFKAKPEIKWTAGLLDKYNRLSTALSNLTDASFQDVTPGGMVFSQAAFDNLPADNSGYGVSAENITFSGNTNIEKTVTVSTTKNRAFSQYWNFDADMFAGLVCEQDVDITLSAGFGVMVGTSKKIVKFDTKTGIVFGYNHEFEKSRESESVKENTTGYVLSDNDAGDQFSVTVIKGNDPTQTPYFSLLAGRSSCPPEPGTIYRDQPLIQAQDIDGKFYNTVQRDLDPDKPYILPVKLMNTAPEIFNEEHYFTLSQVQNYNNYGAKLSVQGTVLGVSEFRIASGGAAYALLQISRPENYYDFNDIRISLGASCPNLAAPDNYTAFDLPLEMYFRHPCSNVTIISPGNNWVIKKANPLAPADADEKLAIRIGDYDVLSPLLESVTVQYRRIGSNAWNDIETVSRETLLQYYNDNKLVYKDPAYYVIWDIKNNAAVVDGNYEIRAKANCGTKGFTYSSSITGTVNRSAVALFGLPQPSDGILSLGDNISVTFNNEILPDMSGVSYKFLLAKDSSEVLATSSVSGKTISFSLGDLSLLDGEVILATLSGVKDLNENTQDVPVKWSFRVVNNPLYWNPEHITVEAYQGTKPKVTAQLINTTAGPQQASIALLNGTWAQLGSAGSVNVLPQNMQNILLNINTQSLQPGVYTDTVLASVNTFKDLKLPVTLRVMPKPVSWVLDPSKYSGSATVICNYNFDSSNVLSKDTLDRIAAFIDGELRGVSNIQKVGQYYRSYINVFGNSADEGKNVKFYVWHASTGIEYAATARNAVSFSINGFFGSTPDPRILDVNTVRDSVRYIKLKAGWNYLALNTTIGDMSVGSALSGLHASDGDLIKTLNTSSQYNASTGKWISVGQTLNSLNTDDGYLLHLEKADTLKVYGSNAELKSTRLVKGWNLIGNPYQAEIRIDTAFNGSGISHLAVIKNDEQAGDYDSALNKWNGISTLKTNKSYMLRNGKTGTLKHNSSRAADLNCSKLDQTAYEYNMTFTAAVKIDGSEIRHSDMYVRAFAGEQCRGTAKLEYVESLDRYLMNLFVYSNTAGEKISFKIYDATSGAWYDVPDSLNVKVNNAYGKTSAPYLFSNQRETSVKDVQAAERELSVSPNPFTGDIAVSFELSSSANCDLQLYDNTGRLVYTQKVQAENGKNKVKINTSALHLQYGVYYVKLLGNGINRTVKVIKL